MRCLLAIPLLLVGCMDWEIPADYRSTENNAICVPWCDCWTAVETEAAGGDCHSLDGETWQYCMFNCLAEIREDQGCMEAHQDLSECLALFGPCYYEESYAFCGRDQPLFDQVRDSCS